MNKAKYAVEFSIRFNCSQSVLHCFVRILGDTSLVLKWRLIRCGMGYMGEV